MICHLVNPGEWHQVQAEWSCLGACFCRAAQRRDAVLEAVRQNDRALDHAPAELRGDRYVIQEAVSHNRKALKHASEELNAECDDGGPEGSKAEWQSFGAALARLRSDHDVVLKAVSSMATPRSMLPQSFAAFAMWFWKQ